MERVDGAGNPRRLLGDEAWAAVRPRLAAECGEALARIHRIPLVAVAGLPEPDPVETVAAKLEVANSGYAVTEGPARD